MKYLIVLAAFLVIGITEVNAQEVVQSKREARKEAKRKKAEKKAEVAVVKTTPVQKTVTEKTKVITKEEVAQALTMVGFKGEMVAGDNVTFSLNISGDTFNLKVNEGMVFVSMSNRRILPFQGIDAIVYTIDNVSLKNTEWEKLMILDLSALSNKEKEAYTNGVATSRNYVLFISGSPQLKLLGDITYGKL